MRNGEERALESPFARAFEGASPRPPAPAEAINRKRYQAPIINDAKREIAQQQAPGNFRVDASATTPAGTRWTSPVLPLAGGGDNSASGEDGFLALLRLFPSFSNSSACSVGVNARRNDA